MIRVHFAPSPTGYLHIGSARTFIFNWLYARKQRGTMVLRIDDTDTNRNTEASLQSIHEELLQNGLTFEGVHRSNADVNFSEQDPIDPKALWLNSQHLRTVPVESLAPVVKGSLASHGLAPFGDDEFFAQVVDTIRSRFSTLRDFSTRGRAYFSDEFEIDKQAALDKLNVPGARKLLRELAEPLGANPEYAQSSVEEDLRKFAEERSVKAGLLSNASRAALTGQPVGPSAFAVFTCIGRERAIARFGEV